MQEKYLARKIGIYVFILICCLFGLVLWKSQLFLKSNSYEVIAKCENIGGLLKGSDVRYRGFTVGKVTDIKPFPSHILIYMRIDKDIKIPISSLAKIKFDGIVGEAYMSIAIINPSPPFIKSGEMIDGAVNSDFSNLIDVSSKSMVHAESILYSTKKIVSSKELSEKLFRIIDNVDELSGGMNEIVKKVDYSIDKNELKETLHQLHHMSLILNKSATELLADGQMVKNVKAIAENLKDITDKLKKTSDDETLRSLQQTIKNFEKVSESLNIILGDYENTNYEEDEGSNFLKIISGLKVKNHIDLIHSPSNQSTYYQTETVLRSNKDFIKIGFGDRNRNIQLSSFQYGSNLTPSLIVRAGLFYQQPGAAIDWQIMKRNTISVSGYNLNHLQFELQNRYNIFKNTDVVLGVRPFNTYSQDTQVDAGVSYKF